jgi:hypothetical protein
MATSRVECCQSSRNYEEERRKARRIMPNGVILTAMASETARSSDAAYRF